MTGGREQIEPLVREARDAFHSAFGRAEPTHMVRAPGRVNLIGEHIDYNGLAVLPMAIQRRILLIFRKRPDTKVRISNANTRFPACAFTLAPEIASSPKGDWGNYVKAPGQALAKEHGPLHGIDGVIHSDIPIAAGLSSSSALVVAIAAALVDANDLAIPTLELGELLARAERYVGTAGGGMDQAICLGAREDSACRIDFDPLALRAIPVPPSWRFVIASSLIDARKSGPAQEAYNRRTHECREALATVVAGLDSALSVDSYRALIAHMSAEDLAQLGDTMLDGVLRRRFHHVVTEAWRVDQAEAALADGEANIFGRLMTESHTSLRDDYEVSCRELDQLTELAMGGGAIGARLTGAGFGGCIVALTHDSDVDAVLAALRSFYVARKSVGGLEDKLFVAHPSGGAVVTTI